MRAGARPRPRSLALPAAGIVLLCGAVLLTRGGTAATEADLAVASPPLPSASDPSSPPPATLTELEADGLVGARLGQAVGRSDTRWVAPYGGDDSPGACTLILSTGDVDVPGLRTSAWRIDSRIVSVAVSQHDRSLVLGLRTWLGPAMGDALSSAESLPSARFERELVAEAVDGDVRTVTVQQDGTETVFSDLGRGQGIAYVEVREPAAERCRLPETPGPGWSSGSGVPVLGAGGWGDVDVGSPIQELVDSGLIQPTAVATGGPGGCPVHLPVDRWSDGGPQQGLGGVYVRDGRVAGVRVIAGRTSEGLAVGDPVTAVERAYPELAGGPGRPTGWTPGTWVSLADGRSLRVAVADGVVAPRSVDVTLPQAQQRVQSVAVVDAPVRSLPCGG